VRTVEGKRVTLADGTAQDFDKVIFASHGDQSLAMLASPTALEADILGKFHYQSNRAVVHSDPRFMPRARRAWASWNYRIENKHGTETHSTHYWMNRLQGVSENENYFVSINPPDVLDPSKVIRELSYEHPIFDTAAITAQSRTAELHEAGCHTNRHYCGAWQRNGFHEDGIWSAHQLCECILNRDPWLGSPAPGR